VLQSLFGQLNRTTFGQLNRTSAEEVTVVCPCIKALIVVWWFFHRVIKSGAGVSEGHTVYFFRATDKPDIRLTFLHTKRIVLSELLRHQPETGSVTLQMEGALRFSETSEQTLATLTETVI
jgi:hypothetical protein